MNIRSLLEQQQEIETAVLKEAKSLRSKFPGNKSLDYCLGLAWLADRERWAKYDHIRRVLAGAGIAGGDLRGGGR